MDGTAILVQLAKSVPAPAAALVAVYWFSGEISRLLEGLGYFIRERKFKTRFPGVSLEITDSESAEVQRTRERIEAAPKPADTSAAVQDVIEARGFVLRDESGRARAEIGLVREGEMSMPVIRLFNAAGRPKVFMTVAGDGEPTVSLISSDDSYLSLNAIKAGSPYVFISSRSDNSRATLDAKILTLANERAVIGEAKEYPAIIALSGRNGEDLFSAP